ncbi:dihydrolipoamide dehydrogenase [Candidatus Phytoplasma luffae]|uniref:Dihydrolipoyl dehydrogenase n=1 Tax=Loofah witches'-broom phytoplasma TaxID=35773 RepID=A0A975FIY1_LOWBP|nr:dihydrolipoyl dehydrogenase [Candidatus Phytoplasma luffae]QTX02652.1 dihydrolipoamide dehydrogenase [Candidatus Phytoplasma luffae]
MVKYDILVVGGGPGGYVAAIKAAQLGAKVVLIEKHKLGGICLNYGCIPTKSFLKSAKIFDTLKHAEQFGIHKNNDVFFDWGSILKRKNQIVEQLNNGIMFLLKKNKIDFYNCFAEILTPHSVKADDKILETKKIIIATGATAFIPPIPGAKESYENKFLYTSKELVNITKFPKKIIIIGGGVIGIEFGTMFQKFGSEVIIIERQSSILSNIDHDIIDSYTKKLKKSGIQIHTNTEVVEIKDNTVYYKSAKEIQNQTADIILMSIGIKPNLKGLEKLNLKTTRQGVITDHFLRTSVENVYAIGDVNGKYMLAHVASHEGIIAVEHALNCQSEENLHHMEYDCVPACIYGFPEIASVGKTEKEVKEQNLNYKISIFNVKNIGKSLADNETEGFAKIIIDKDNYKILGMHILSYNATELITEISVIMKKKGTVHDIANTIHPHPTLSELIHETVLGAIDKPIHM